jgi:hypothetical protein
MWVSLSGRTDERSGELHHGSQILPGVVGGQKKSVLALGHFEGLDGQMAEWRQGEHVPTNQLHKVSALCFATYPHWRGIGEAKPNFRGRHRRGPGDLLLGEASSVNVVVLDWGLTGRSALPRAYRR